MRKLPIVITLFVLLLTPVGAWALHFSDYYILPVAAHTAGANGTFYLTDISVQNFQASPLTVDLFFIESGESAGENVSDIVSTTLPNGSVTVPARGNLVIKDVLGGFQGRDNRLLGAILIRGNLAFAVTGRNYTNSAVGTVGHTIPPVRDFIENQTGDTNTAMAVAYVPGLISNSAFRTNLGMVVGTASSAMTVEVLVRGADGTNLGTRSFTIPAASFRHLHFNVSSFAGTFDIGGAEYRITSGDGAVAPYATVVDNGNGDAVFISSVFPPNVEFGKTGLRGVFDSLVDRLKSR